MIDPVACVKSVLIQNEEQLFHLDTIANEMRDLTHDQRMVLKDLPQELALTLLLIEDKYAAG